ncbi:uncharacterized protein LOC144139099 [Haemaphysalis longicornis]
MSTSMDAAIAVACVTASLLTVWCLSECYLRYVYAHVVVDGMLPFVQPRPRPSNSYGSLDPCQEVTPSYKGNASISFVESADSKPPPYAQCVIQESEPPPSYVECLPEE